MGEIVGLFASVSLLGMTFIWTTQAWTRLDHQIARTKDVWQVERQTHACGSWLALQENVKEFKVWQRSEADDTGLPLSNDVDWLTAEHELLEDLGERFVVDRHLCDSSEVASASFGVFPFRQGQNHKDLPPNWTYRFEDGGVCGSCTDIHP